MFRAAMGHAVVIAGVCAWRSWPRDAAVKKIEPTTNVTPSATPPTALRYAGTDPRTKQADPMMNKPCDDRVKERGPHGHVGSFPRRYPCRDTIPVGRAWGGAPHDETTRCVGVKRSAVRHPQKTSDQSFFMLTTVQPSLLGELERLLAPAT